MEIINIKDHRKCIPEVAGWLFQEWGHLTPGASLELSIHKLKERCIEDKIPLTFVAVENRQVVGTISIVPHDMKTRMDLTPWIASVFVKPEARNRGIGSHMMRFAEQECLNMGLSKIYLFTPNKQRMYAGLGWKRADDVEYRGEQVTIMEKALQTS